MTTVERRGWYGALAIAVAMLGLRISSTRHGLWVDLDVYVAGGKALLEGQPLYEVRSAGLPFTYPPFAAVVFIPLTFLGEAFARLLVSIVSIASLCAVAFVVGRRLELPSLPVVVVVVGALGSEPVVRNLILGQINMVLMLLVVLDLLVVPARWRGLLTGVATGIKLVPGAFILLLVLRRDLSSVVRAVIAVAATVAIGWVQPASSREFWAGGLWDLGVGDTVIRADNQSLAGLAMRMTGRPDVPLLLQLAITAGALGVGLWCASRVSAGSRGAPLQLAIVSVASLLASPVSWTHHWVWMLPVVLALVSLRKWALVASVVVVFWIGLVWLAVPAGQSRSYSWPNQVLAASFVLVGAVAVAVMSRAGRGQKGAPPLSGA